MRWIMLALLVLSGCSSQSARVDAIAAGMYRSEVIEVLGKPDSIRHVNSIIEEWRYSISVSNTALKMRCSGAALQGAPRPPECYRDHGPEEYDLVITIILDAVAGYQKYDKKGRLLTKVSHQPTDKEQEQYLRDYEAWQAQEAARRQQEWEDYEEAERKRRCEDTLRQNRSGNATDRQVDDACVGR